MNNLERNDKKQVLALTETTNNQIGSEAKGKDFKGKALKIVGDNRHFSPANKEWKNSTYAYNKNNLRSISALDNIAGKIIKNYFNLSNSKKIARSKRMRNLIRRSTIKRLFVSKPEIKQTSDKVMITVYTFDREKQFFIRKLYFYNKSLNLYKLWLNKTLSSVSLSLNRNRKGKNLLAYATKRTLNPLYTNSVNVLSKQMLKTRNNGMFASTSRFNKNKTYIHKLLLNKRSGTPLSLINHPFLNILRKRQAVRSSVIQKRASMKLLSNIRKNYFSKLFAKKLGLALKKNLHTRLSYKQFIRKPSHGLRKTRLFNLNTKVANYSKKSAGGNAKIRIPYFNLKLKNEMKFFFFKLAYVKKFDYLRKLFFFYFMKYTLSLFQTKINIYHKNMRNVEGGNVIIEFTTNSDNNLGQKYYKIIKNNSNNKLKLIQSINMELLQFLDLTLVNSKVNDGTVSNTVSDNKKRIYSLYEYFKVNYFILFLRKSLKKELLALNYYTKFVINQYKFGKFLPGLKHLISRIYSKKVELNLVNLKYSHLNSDIYTESIASKLKKKVSLLKVLRRSLNLARTPYKFFSVNNAANINNLQSLNIFKSLDLNNNGLELSVIDQNAQDKDKIHVILNKLYPNSLAQSFNLKSFITLATKNSIKNQEGGPSFNENVKAGAVAKDVKVLNQIRYKWVTGIRLEAAGRLTRRFTASRSVFKYRYKGNLKNIDYSLKTDISKNNISTIMLRNYVQPNLQYSFAKSKRRIGAFGVKGWINSY